ncbi:transposase family protein [Streptomyces sp. NPDC002187]|uniref:transposase family protein n=1 Tax=Streptomyces sp. NPDC002187 TaxID=3364637 RepID=UPI003693A922
MRAATAACRCGRRSGRVRGWYVRQLRDAAVGGLGVVIELCVRRFRCETPPALLRRSPSRFRDSRRTAAVPRCCAGC